MIPAASSASMPARPTPAHARASHVRSLGSDASCAAPTSPTRVPPSRSVSSPPKPRAGRAGGDSGASRAGGFSAGSSFGCPLKESRPAEGDPPRAATTTPRARFPLHSASLCSYVAVSTKRFPTRRHPVRSRRRSDAGKRARCAPIASVRDAHPARVRDASRGGAAPPVLFFNSPSRSAPPRRRATRADFLRPEARVTDARAEEEGPSSSSSSTASAARASEGRATHPDRSSAASAGRRRTKSRFASHSQSTTARRRREWPARWRKERPERESVRVERASASVVGLSASDSASARRAGRWHELVGSGRSSAGRDEAGDGAASSSRVSFRAKYASATDSATSRWRSPTAATTRGSPARRSSATASPASRRSDGTGMTRAGRPASVSTNEDERGVTVSSRTNIGKFT